MAVDAAMAEKLGLAYTFPGRLLQAGFSESIARAESKDALFAGIDTTEYKLVVIRDQSRQTQRQT